jgi:YjbE family integral membrane protein
MDGGTLGTLTLDWQFASALAGIVLVDLVLAGDNAVVIAMAVRSLPREQRRQGILLGSAAAVLLRVAATFFVARLLQTPYVKLAGGILIGWVAVRLFAGSAPAGSGGREAGSVGQAVRLIVVADVTMSLDNMLAVGGISGGNLYLLLFGLALSIPFVVFTSSLLSYLMDRYPAIVYAGAAVLGKVAAEMVLTDPATAARLPLTRTALLAAEAAAAGAVILLGRLLVRLRAARAEAAAAPACGPGGEG